MAHEVPASTQKILDLIVAAASYIEACLLAHHDLSFTILLILLRHVSSSIVKVVMQAWAGQRGQCFLCSLREFARWTLQPANRRHFGTTSNPSRDRVRERIVKGQWKYSILSPLGASERKVRALLPGAKMISLRPAVTRPQNSSS